MALITAAREYALYAYVVLSLLVGLRTEEARALRWDHVHLDTDPGLPPHIDVWRSVRAPVVTSGAEMMDRIFADCIDCPDCLRTDPSVMAAGRLLRRL